MIVVFKHIEAMNINNGKQEGISSFSQDATSSIRQNLVANYAGTAISTGMPLLTLPIFLFLLGADIWGMVAFFWLLIGLVSIVEAGIGQALIREFGIRLNHQQGSTQSIYNLIHTYERLYWAGSGLCAAILVSSSNLIVERWLHLDGLPQAMGKQAVYAAAAMIVITISGSLYRSVLLAAKAHISLNKLLSIFSITRYGGGAVAVYLYPSFSVYLGWQVLVSILEVFWLRQASKKALPSPALLARWEYRGLQDTFRSVSQLFLATLLSAFTVQIDKLTISALLPISQLGYYSIASSLVLGLLRLVYPIQSTLLPHLIEVQHSFDQTKRHNCHAYLLTIGMILAIGISYSIFGKTLLAIWLANPRAVSEVSSLLPLLLAGAALNALYGIQYVNWLALGRSKRIMGFNFAFFLIGLMITPAAVIMLGVQGAAIGWLTINLIGAIAGLQLLSNSLTKRCETH